LAAGIDEHESIVIGEYEVGGALAAIQGATGKPAFRRGEQEEREDVDVDDEGSDEAELTMASVPAQVTEPSWPAHRARRPQPQC
jgi:hypothetical protein